MMPLLLAAVLAVSAAPNARPRIETPQIAAPKLQAGRIPPFWICLKFRYSVAADGERPAYRTMIVFDQGTPAFDEREAAEARMREVREHGGEWMAVTDWLPHGVPVNMLDDVWVEQYNEPTGTVCGRQVPQ